MLTGIYHHTVDSNNRLFIPAKLREDLGESFLIFKDIRAKCLKVYPQSGWEAYVGPIKQQNRALGEEAIRLLYKYMTEVTPDAQGRIVVRADILEKANIEREVIIQGCGEYAEIWSSDGYRKMEEDLDEAAVVARLEACGL